MALERLIPLYLCVGAIASPVAQSNNSVISIPYEYTYLLPNNFQGDASFTFCNSTQTSSDEINNLFSAANKAPIISYDDSFLDIVGHSPKVELVKERTGDYFAYEAGVWIPEKNEVWLSSSVSGTTLPGVLQSMNLDTYEVRTINGSKPILNPDGAYYFEGKVYIATYPDNTTYSGGVVSIDVETLEVETVTNSYFGLRYNGIDDIVWATSPETGCKYMFYSDLNYAYIGYDNLPPLQLPANVYRWDPQEKVVLPVISRNELNPNGVRVSPDMRTLYVTDTVATFAEAGPYNPASGPADTFWLGPYIYAYDLDKHMMPANRRVFGMVSRGIADGLHIDDAGNVWTAESDGVVVRNPAGKTIGVFNGPYYLSNKDNEAGDPIPIANFALAGDTLVILAVDRIWTVKLAKTIVAKDSPIVN